MSQPPNSNASLAEIAMCIASQQPGKIAASRPKLPAVFNQEQNNVCTPLDTGYPENHMLSGPVQLAGSVLREGPHTVLERGFLNHEQILFKVLRSTLPSPSEIAILEREQQILEMVRGPGVPEVLDFVRRGPRIGLVLADPGGRNLQDVLAGKRGLPLPQFLTTALLLAQTLDRMHARGITHRNIKPANILYQGDGSALLIDFEQATFFARERMTVSARDTDGSLAYISPEQTGRINRVVDYRTDIYSLGITLFQALTGSLPFSSRDPMEMVHSHIATLPPNPSDLDKKIPRTLSRIILRMLEKAPESRYQSAAGLISDLRKCEKGLREQGEIPEFSPGAGDTGSLFSIPEQLFGRTQEKRILTAALDRALAGEKQALVITGEPGIGKSSLVSELQRPVIEARGFFLRGSFERFQTDEPYSAVIAAFRIALRQIMGESDAKVHEWQFRFRKELESYAGVLASVLPELGSFVWGDRATTPLGSMSRAEFERQMEESVVRFLDVLASSGGPVLLFVDDVQWADYPSLRLLKFLRETTRLRCLLLVISFRESGLPQTHVPRELLDDPDLEKLKLGALAIADIKAALEQVLSRTDSEIDRLANLLREKTGGNPFFFLEYLRALHSEGLIHYRDGWQWDFASIRARSVANNVVDFLVARIQSESPALQNLLKLASCYGESTRVELLTEASNTTPAQVTEELVQAVERGFMILENDYVTFVHDRIREAAYSLLDPKEREESHLSAGRALLRRVRADDEAEVDFAVANQLNRVHEKLGAEERITLAATNLRAGQRARLAGAFSDADAYFAKGLTLLPEDAWRSKYRLCYELHAGLAECRYLSGDFEKARSLFDLVLSRATTKIDQALIRERQLLIFLSEGKLSESIDAGIAGLKTLGMRIRKNPGQLGALPDLLIARIRLLRRSIESLENLPASSLERESTALRLMMVMGNAAFIGRPLLVPVLISRMVVLSLKHGNFPQSPFAYAMFGVILSALGDYESAYRFGELGMSLLTEQTNHEVRGKVLYIHACFLKHLKEHGRYSTEFFQRGYNDSVSGGDTQFQSYNANHYCIQLLLTGGNLELSLEQFDRYTDALVRAGNYDPIQYHFAWKQFARSLIDGNTEARRLTGPEFDFAAVEKQLTASNSVTVLFSIYMLRGILNYLFHEPQTALDFLTRAREFEPGVVGMPFVPHSCFYEGLAAIKVADGEPARRSLIRRAARMQSRLKKWSQFCPANYEHKTLLLGAEIDRIRGNENEAARGYDRAVESALENGFYLEAALANELAGAFHQNSDRARMAHMYLSTAHRLYADAGARAMLPRLEQMYTFRFTEQEDIARGRGQAATAAGNLDLSTVIKASHAISEEIRLDSLLEKLLRIMMENAGASRGALILDRDGALRIEALMKSDSGNELAEPVPLADSNLVSERVVYLVNRTHETVVLEDAERHPDYSTDSYVRKNRARSILCGPIIKGRRMIGIVYLENNLSSGVFTSDRLEVLGLLTSQAGISLENAHLYANLEKKVDERTLLLNEKKQELEASLEEVQQLKTEQDCDYYLTSLLLEPLAANRVDNRNVRIDFYLEQKKKFRYRKWESSLGGDICSAHSVRLRGKDYSVFVNADAMGKSIQGAGGALVLGAVFEALIQRTKLTKQIQDQHPEQWLRYSFVELQKVFESFEGYMMVTLVLGIVNDETGAFYFVNAEHPDLVLYRNAKAEFLRPVAVYAKIGRRMPADMELWSELRDDIPLSIACFQLQRGDIIVSASDGRDDIGLGRDSSGNAIVNEDSDWFRRVVEDASGYLDAMQTRIHEGGELLDDLSILRLEYRGEGLISGIGSAEERELAMRLSRARTNEDLRETVSWLESFTSSPRPLLSLVALARIHFRLRSYEAALVYAEQYIERNQLDNRLLFMALKLYRILGKLGEAIDMAERLRLRDPMNPRILRRQIDLFMKTKDERRLDAAIRDLSKIESPAARNHFREYLEAIARKTPG